MNIVWAALSVWLLGILPPFQVDGLVPSYWERTPLPQTGLATFYAEGMMEHVLDVRAGHGQYLLCDECVGTVALLRAGDIGRKVWLQPPDGEKVGPFLVIDCARQEDVWPLVDRNWVVDVSFEVGQFWSMDRPLDGVTVLADPADEDDSFLTDGPWRVPTPFFVSPDKVVVSAPTPTPAVSPTPAQPTRWPTRLPVPLAAAAASPVAVEIEPTSVPLGTPPPTPLTPVITTPTPRVLARGTQATPPAAPGGAVAPAQTPTPVAIGRAGAGLLGSSGGATPAQSRPTGAVTPSPSPTASRMPRPLGTTTPILQLPIATPAPPESSSGDRLLDFLRALLEWLRR